jgi:3-oxoacyl-[acyl-carrier-protein] synthase-3
MDIRNQCSFFVYALTMAEALIAGGRYKRILICGSEIHSTGVEMNERGKDVAILFGDGAGAVVVGPAIHDGQGILATDLHADGSFADRLQIPWGSAQQDVYITKDQIERGEIFPKMNGTSVFKNAVTKMPESIRTSLGQCGLGLDDVALFICHQANLRIVEYVQKSLKLGDDKFYNNIQRYGNTTAASIPIALDECVRSGRLQRGQVLCVAAFGAGFTWGSAVIRF